MVDNQTVNYTKASDIELKYLNKTYTQRFLILDDLFFDIIIEKNLYKNNIWEKASALLVQLNLYKFIALSTRPILNPSQRAEFQKYVDELYSREIIEISNLCTAMQCSLKIRKWNIQILCWLPKNNK